VQALKRFWLLLPPDPLPLLHPLHLRYDLRLRGPQNERPANDSHG